MPSFWNIVLNTPRATLHSLFGENPSETIGNALVALSIGLGAVLGFYIWYKISEYCTHSNSSRRFSYDKRTQRHKEITSKRSRNVIRLILMVLAISTLLTGCWIAGNAAGFNFWTVIFGYGIMSMVGTYAFGSTLQNAGAFFLIALTDKIEEEWYIRIPAAQAEGRIKAIHIIFIELEYFDEEAQVVREIQIPTAFVIAQVVWRLFEKERAYAQKDKKDTLYPNNRFMP